VLEDPIAPIYDPEEWRDLNLAWMTGEPIDQPTGLGVAIENFADVAHFPFVHQGSMGPTLQAVESLDVRREGSDVYMLRQAPASDGAWGSQGPSTMLYHIIVPGFVSITYDHAEVGKRVVVGFPSPVAYENLKIFWAVANETTFAGDSLEQILKLETAVYLEDVPVVSCLLHREVPWDGEVKEISVPSDRFTLTYRRAMLDLIHQVAEVNQAPQSSANGTEAKEI
jgi:hypothetical protein